MCFIEKLYEHAGVKDAGINLANCGLKASKKLLRLFKSLRSFKITEINLSKNHALVLDATYFDATKSETGQLHIAAKGTDKSNDESYQSWKKKNKDDTAEYTF